MKSSKRFLVVAVLLGIAVPSFLFASKDEIYFAFNHDQMVEELNNKHLSKLLKAPTNGRNQESLINQIRLLRSSRWNRFISAENFKLLDQKLMRLNEGVERRNILSEISQEETAKADKAAASRRELLANKGKMDATVTRYLLDAPPKITEGEATYNQADGYIEFFNKNDGGHRCNHRCYRSGNVTESDSITTKDLWENEPDYTCSIDLGPSGLPVGVVVSSLSNNGFVALRGRFSSRQNQAQEAAKPYHCPMTIKQKQLIIDQLAGENITGAEGRSKIASIKTEIDQCY
jgi:hypothetical protein